MKLSCKKLLGIIIAVAMMFMGNLAFGGGGDDVWGSWENWTYSDLFNFIDRTVTFVGEIPPDCGEIRTNKPRAWILSEFLSNVQPEISTDENSMDNNFIDSDFINNLLNTVLGEFLIGSEDYYSLKLNPSQKKELIEDFNYIKSIINYSDENLCLKNFGNKEEYYNVMDTRTGINYFVTGEDLCLIV